MPIGTVKWFQAVKGFGFITEDGTDTDFFLHFKNIEMEGYKLFVKGLS